MNHLYFGDNLAVLREHIADASVDLIYLDPPFNSNASYNVLFKGPEGTQSQAQIEAFDDTWHWTDVAEHAFSDVLRSGNTDAAEMLRAMRQFLGQNDMMAYLAMMAVRLIELHRVLKPTGSLYLHCDPTASHYLKILLDAVFGARFFQNEITWKRTGSHGDSKTWSRVTDKIFFYNKSERFVWNTPYEKHNDSYVDSHYSNVDESGRRYKLTSVLSPSPRPRMMYEWRGFPSPPLGWRFSKEKMAELDEAGLIWYPTQDDGSLDNTKRPRYKRYLDEQKGVVVSTIWSDIPPINSRAQERLGYPTQKPVALLERIVAASSNPGDVVLDPFCGCGTTVHAAEKLGRQWIGIDVTHLAIGLIQRRLRDAFGADLKPYEVHGVPRDLPGAQALAEQDKHQFELWAVSLIPNAQPWKGGKKGADQGRDGILYVEGPGRRTETCLIEVKGGKTGDKDVARLLAALEQHKAKMGIFVTLNEPTKPMIATAASAGTWETDWGPVPRLQVVTIEQLLQPVPPLRIPMARSDTYKKAAREKKDTQGALDL